MRPIIVHPVARVELEEIGLPVSLSPGLIFNF